MVCTTPYLSQYTMHPNYVYIITYHIMHNLKGWPLFRRFPAIPKSDVGQAAQDIAAILQV